jgi:hypothetical protein
VTHTAWLFVTQSSLRSGRLAADLDVFALLITAMCHDLEHDGVTNAFLVNTESPLARLYNDASPNENHHAAVCFRLLDAHGLLRGLRRADALLFRKLALAAILATDMACHKELIVRVSASLADATEHAAAATKEAARVTMVAFILHCADLCCPLLPPQMSRRVAGDLSREFAAQAVRERAAALPVTVMEASNDISKAKMVRAAWHMRSCAAFVVCSVR